MKKGFTLIELLAVIIILAVISTIVVPIVANIVQDSKKSTYQSSIELYGKAVKQAILNYELDKKVTPTTFKQIKPYLEFEGNNVECDTKIIYEDGEIYLKDCSVDGNFVEDYTYGKRTLSDTMLKQAIENNYYYETKPDFSKMTTSGEYGLYKTKDDLGDSYYFRGDVENNYVKFGQWHVDTEVMSSAGGYGPYPLDYCQQSIGYAPWTSCDEFQVGKIGNSMYWRIIRINGDGTIRLIYDGTKAETNDSSLGNYIHYDLSKNTSYSITQFYTDNLNTKYSDYIADSIFCEEKVVTSEDDMAYSFSNWDRINSNLPKLTCTRAEDKLTQKIGFITADEALMGGSESGVNSYLYGDPYYSFTPGYQYKESSPAALVIYNSSIGYIGDNGSYVAATRPVINLKADVRFTGTGTIDDPYVIMTD